MLRPRFAAVGFLVAAAITAALLGARGTRSPLPSAPPAAPERVGTITALTVDVVDATGAPVEGAELAVRIVEPARPPEEADAWRDLSAREAAGRLLDSHRTDAEGRAVLHVPLDARVEVRLGGGASEVAVAGRGTFTAASPKRLTMWRVAASPVRFRILDGDGRALAAELLGDAWSGRWTLPVAMDADPPGSVHVGVPQDGSCGFEVWLPARRARTGFFVHDSGETMRALTVPSTAALAGRLVDTKGRGIGGAEVRVVVSAERPLTRFATETTADANGAYRFDALPPGRLESLVARQGRREGGWKRTWRRDVSLPSGQTVPFDVLLREPGIVSGVVTDAETRGPVPDATVWLVPLGGELPTGARRSVRTDPDGAYRFERTPCGRYAVVVQDEKRASRSLLDALSRDPTRGWTHALLPPERIVVLLGDAESARCDLVATRGESVAGRVIDRQDEVVPGADLWIRAPGSRYRAWCGDFERLHLGTTAADGTFRVSLPPVGRDWALEARHARGTAQVADLSGWGREDLVRLRLESPVRLRGRIVDEHGRGRGGIAVRRGTAQAVTSPDGTLVLEGAPEESGHAVCDADGPSGHCLRRAVQLTAGNAIPETVVPALARIEGFVLDAEERPFAGAFVHVDDRDGMDSAPTAADGSFSLEAAPGPLHLSAWVPVNGSAELMDLSPVALAPAVGARFHGNRPPAEPLHVLHVSVVDPEDRPVPVCRISTGRWSFTPFDGASMEEDVVGGSARMEVYGALPESLYVSAPADREGKPLALQAAVVAVTREEAPLVVRLITGVDLAGRVVDEKDRGVGGMRVEEPLGGRTASWTDAEGRFALRGFASGEEIRVGVAPPADDVDVRPIRAHAGDSDVTFHLARGLSIAGRVRHPDGRPADGVGVHPRKGGLSAIGLGHAYTDEEGRFRLRGIPAGTVVNLEIETRDDAGGPRARANVNDVAAGTTDLSIVLEEGVSLSGAVVRPDDEPLSGVRVEARKSGAARAEGAATTGEKGEFRIDGLTAGPHVLRVSTALGLVLVRDGTVTVPSRDPMRIHVPTARLSGRIEGIRQPGWDLQVSSTGPLEDGKDVPINVPIDASGSFSLDVLAGETYELFAWNRKGDDRFLVVDHVSAGVSEKLALCDGGFLEGRVEDAQGRPVPRAALEARDANSRWRLVGTADAQGRFAFRGVPPGAWRVATTAWPYGEAADYAFTNTRGIRVHPR